ncbi:MULTISPECIES: MFS transporter [unclassified Chelatococcus]|uniref:MFS transporter n=1 Tax=unclassified Chelatococcus TaxID=2638111 RepID=UPI001BD10CA7|nr:MULTISPECIES: MFS transporter [unclassified Chelatococcus]MBS7699431.1 MFS transporter [Chelatococcus sp. YT9]MBX3557677.1 MFS transporter [Chelatococcus sp.]
MKSQTGFGLLLWSSCLAMLAVGANSTAIMAALPLMKGELSLTSAGLEWAVNAYLVMSAACVVLGGKAADRLTARVSSTVGLAVFGLASCVIASAETQAALLVGRGLQGLGAAFAVPGTLAAINGGAVPERRDSAIGAWTGFLMLGFSIGPLVGGSLTHIAGWRVVFWFNVPLVVAALAGFIMAGQPAQGRKASSEGIDATGFVLLATFMISIIFGLHALPHAKTTPLSLILPSVLAIGAFTLLLIVERRVKAPMVDLSFFTQRGFVVGTMMGALSMLCIMALLLYFNLYAQSQDGLDLTALEAGALLLPLGAALLGLALSASAISARTGLRNAMTGGMALVVLASLLTSAAVAAADMSLLAVGFFVMGSGLAVPYALAPRLALSALPPSQAGQGAGVVNASTFLGGSIGVAAGAIAFAIAGFTGVLTMIALAGAAGAALSRRIP